MQLRHEASFVHPDMREQKLADAMIWDRKAVETDASGGVHFKRVPLDRATGLAR